jgi:site-specific recombinase XerD
LFGRLDGAPDYGKHDLQDIKRKHIHDYVDYRLTNGYSAKGINYDIRCFQATLRFLEDREYAIPLSLLTIRGIKEPDRLPRFLTDNQVSRLREEIEDAVARASTAVERRNALLNRAVFYLFWHAEIAPILWT